MRSLFRNGDAETMSRWAVLWDVFGDAARPVGLAVEHPGHVHVFAPPSYGVPTRFNGEYRVLQPDGSLLTYRPESPRYFDQVVVELSRAFSVGEMGQSANLDRDSLIELYLTKVINPQRRVGAGREYIGGLAGRRGGGAYTAHQPRYGHPPRRGLLNAA
jgi:hypothetical protein